MGTTRDQDVRANAFTLVELLVSLAIIAVLAALLLSALSGAKAKAKAVYCLHNLSQWGVAVHLYALDGRDFLPKDGKPTPLDSDLARADYHGWYIDLPAVMRIQRYADVPWRMNPAVEPGPSVWICPANPRRANVSTNGSSHNLFHYCANGVLDGTGDYNRQVKLTAIRQPSAVVYLFDSKNLPAVQTSLHSPANFLPAKLHGAGAQILFLDAHAARFASRSYWDASKKAGITNNPDLVWIP